MHNYDKIDKNKLAIVKNIMYKAGKFYALVAELVDAADLKSVGRKTVPVRFRPSAPIKNVLFMRAFFVGMINIASKRHRCRFDYKRNITAQLS